MKKGLFSIRTLGSTVAILALSSVSAQAAVSINWSSLSTAVDTTSCISPVFSQPFSLWKDSHFYALAPGQQVGSFNGAGWTLLGGARVVTTTLPDGWVAQVLDVPAGGSAVSPPMCVTSAYPTARSMVRNVSGAAGLKMSVDYTKAGTWLNPTDTGTVHGTGTTWTASGVIDIHPGNLLGWQEARFAFVGVGADTQLYNFYVDPRMK